MDLNDNRFCPGMIKIKEKTMGITAKYIKKEEAETIREKKNLRMMTWDIFSLIKKGKTTKKLIEKLNTYNWEDYTEDDPDQFNTKRTITALDLIGWLQK